ncbi:MAG: hypothetical protein M3270_06125 [Thermoproteota archaeon]|nr:hypothetical protein [Thermoproteota archaeon]
MKVGTLACTAAVIIFAAIAALPIPPTPTAIAQEETSLGEERDDLTSSIISNVLDDGGDVETNQDQSQAVDQTDVNEPTAVVDANQDADADATAAAMGLGLQLEEVVEEESTIRPTSPGEEPQEDEGVWCTTVVNENLDTFCFDSPSDCEGYRAFIEIVFKIGSSECEEFETFPPDVWACNITGQDPLRFACERNTQ